MKKGKQIDVKLNLSVRTFYIFIALGILAIAGVGVYAASYSAAGAGHPYSEITTCGEGQFLEVIGGVWTCATYPSTTSNCAWINYDAKSDSYNPFSDEVTPLTCPPGKALRAIRENSGYVEDNNPSISTSNVDVVSEILCC
ncbi:MAG: hypothetical protein WC511_04880 [Candidatus Pacearchaeota archaeon]